MFHIGYGCGYRITKVNNRKKKKKGENVCVYKQFI